MFFLRFFKIEKLPPSYFFFFFATFFTTFATFFTFFFAGMSETPFLYTKGERRYNLVTYNIIQPVAGKKQE
jgi:hypothetical protein